MTSAKIKKAVFPVAGLGTRFLPATKANPKEMLPIVDKPLIQYAAEEAVAAGIETLVFVTGRNKRSIEDHFDKAWELETELQSKQKHALLEAVQYVIPSHISCIYIRQSEARGLGHAVLCAQPAVGNEPFAIILADDLIIDDKTPCLSQMEKIHTEFQCGVIGVQQVEKEDVSKYGILGGDKIRDRLWNIQKLVEKPKPEQASSNVAVVGRYILNPSIFSILQQTKKGAGGEIQLTDAIAKQLKSEQLIGYEFKGKRYDCGNKLGYLEATVELGLKHEEIGKQFRSYLKENLPKLIK